MITACEAVEGNKFGLYTLDKELAARAYTAGFAAGDRQRINESFVSSYLLLSGSGLQP